jgi:hypothetical protein
VWWYKTKKMEEFKKDIYYKAKQLIFTPNGIVKEGLVFTGEQWEDILVYGIGNCGIEAMFDIVDRPIEESAEANEA